MSAEDMEHIVSSLVYSGIGMVMFIIAFFIIVKISPFSVQKEIESYDLLPENTHNKLAKDLNTK